MLEPLSWIVVVTTLANGGSESMLRDGTRVRVTPPYQVDVLIPSPRQQAEALQIMADFEERAAKHRRMLLAVDMKRADPKRSIASIAKEMNVSASALGKRVKKAA